MRCMNPIRLMSRDLLTGKFNYVPCGLCQACQTKKRQDWIFRINKEIEQAKAACFITLTYDESKVPTTKNGELTLKKDDLKDFFKRLRVNYQRKGKSPYRCLKITYFACGEYGHETNRPHYHSLVFNLAKIDRDLIAKSWSHGFVTVDDVLPARVVYITKYIMKGDGWSETDRIKPFMVCSQGIGKNYLVNSERHKKGLDFTVRLNGVKMSMPRYYQDKIFTKSDKVKNANRIEQVTDYRIIEEMEKYGDDYFKEKLSQQQQFINQFNKKKTKKGKL